MANSIAGTYADITIDEVFETYVLSLAPFNAFSTDLSNDLKANGETIQTPLIGAGTVNNTENSYRNLDGITTTKIDVTLDHYAIAPFYLKDSEANKNQVDIWNGMARSAVRALAAEVFEFVMGKVLAASYAQVGFTGAASTFDIDSVADIGNAMDALGIPPEMRAMILSGDYYTSLIKDNVLQQVNTSGSNLALVKGRVNELNDFSMFKSASIPGNSENLVGIASHPSAMAIAMRAVRPQQGFAQAGGVFSERTEPETGLTLNYREFYDTGTGIRHGCFETLVGASVAQGNGILRLISA